MSGRIERALTLRLTDGTAKTVTEIPGIMGFEIRAPHFIGVWEFTQFRATSISGPRTEKRSYVYPWHTITSFSVVEQEWENGEETNPGWNLQTSQVDVKATGDNP